MRGFRQRLVWLCLASVCQLSSSSYAAGEDEATPTNVDQEAPNENVEAPPKETKPVVPPEAKVKKKASPRPWQAGGSLAVKIPHGINAMISGRLGGMWVAYAATGGYKSRYQDVEFGTTNTELGVRFFPWRKVSFIGLSYGQQKLALKASRDLVVSYGDAELETPGEFGIEVETHYLTPHLGYELIWKSGVTLGSDVGYQFNLGFQSRLRSNFADFSGETIAFIQDQETYKKVERDVDGIVNKYAKKGMPQITLLRIGYTY